MAIAEFGGLNLGLTIEGYAVDAFDDPDTASVNPAGTEIYLGGTYDGFDYEIRGYGTGLSVTGDQGGYSYDGTIGSFDLYIDTGPGLSWGAGLLLPYDTSVQALSDAAGEGTPLSGLELRLGYQFRVQPALGPAGDVTYQSHSEFFDLILPPAGTFGLVANGSQASDMINTYVTDDNVSASGGEDLIRLSPGFDFIDGGTGRDTVDGRLLEAPMVFDGATGVITSGPDSTTITNVEVLIGTTQGDTLTAGGVTREVYGSYGDDLINGSLADDILSGGLGDDTILGDAGNDTLSGEDGSNVLDGGDGVDLADYTDSPGRVLVDLMTDVSGAGFARFYDYGASQGDTYANIEDVQSGDYADNLRGDGAENELLGGGVSDRLYGRGGNDWLDGGTGADALYGNLGADIMTGGPDAGRTDRYIYFQASESGVGQGNRDVITDFVAGEDRIELSRIDADTTQGFKQAFDFIGEDPFSGTAGELRYEQGGGITVVQADRDGDGAADFEIELMGLVDLTAGDFLI